MSQAALSFSVFFVEEPLLVLRPGEAAVLRTRSTQEGVTVVTPLLPATIEEAAVAPVQRALLEGMLSDTGGGVTVAWFYTPLAFGFAGHLRAKVVVYDCMDELTLFRGASPRLALLERQLLKRADLVFTGGRSLFEAKRHLHANVHLFPSSVDAEHFNQARDHVLAEPADQVSIRKPRIGYFGVVDERIDYDLLDAVAGSRPDWQVVMIGPTAKVDPAGLPQRPNLHWLGIRSYADLPAYLGGWDVGIMPFAINEATRFISPTKTPEFLAAGLPVVSTPIRDVVDVWAQDGSVQIAQDPAAFCAAIEGLLGGTRPGWLAQVDDRLKCLSWRLTWSSMLALIQGATLHSHDEDRRPTPPRQSEVALIGARLRVTSALAEQYDWLVVGAGFAGAVLAERLATERGDRVLVIDKRDHVAGNAYDHFDGAGVLVHRYGPHIFHTNSQAVHDYLSRFTAWRSYEHRVLGRVNGQLLPIPINLDTVNRLYNLSLTSEELEVWFAARAEAVETVRTSEDVIVSRIGRELYEIFFQAYTRKQWGLDPSELDRTVTARVPVRTDRDDRYFTDSLQTMPREGYTKMFDRMLDHPGIQLMLGTGFESLNPSVSYRRMIWTGPVDEYFGFRYGKLPYRSLRFRHETIQQPRFQSVGTVNYPQDEEYTRISEYKHMTGQEHPWTSITYEYPTAEGDPYYPIPRPENQALYKQYEAAADACADTWFVGRLATYRYLNMDQVVAQALATFRRIESELPGREQTRAVAGESARIPAERA